MATFLGAINTAIGATYGKATVAGISGPANWVTGGFVDGKVKVNMDYYVALGTETAGAIITMGNLLPVGAKIIGHLLQISASTGSLTISVGDLETATRYVSASTSPATAGSYWFGGGKDATVGYYVIGTTTAPTATSNDQQIILTTGGATLAVSTVICLATIYTTD